MDTWNSLIDLRKEGAGEIYHIYIYKLPKSFWPLKFNTLWSSHHQMYDTGRQHTNYQAAEILLFEWKYHHWLVVNFGNDKYS